MGDFFDSYLAWLMFLFNKLLKSWNIFRLNLKNWLKTRVSKFTNSKRLCCLMYWVMLNWTITGFTTQLKQCDKIGAFTIKYMPAKVNKARHHQLHVPMRHSIVTTCSVVSINPPWPFEASTLLYLWKCTVGHGTKMLVWVFMDQTHIQVMLHYIMIWKLWR